MIRALFNYNIKTNRVLFVSLVLVMTMYYSIMISMYDPDSIDAIQAMLDAFPQEMISALGFTNFGDTLLTFISGYIYGFLIFLFPMIFTIVTNHKLIASLVDKGSMTSIVASPHSRLKIITTQLLTSILMISSFFILTTILSMVVAELMFPHELDISMYIKLNLYTIVLYLAISSIVFFASSIANDAKTSLSIGVGIPVSFLVIQMLSGIGDQFKWLENFTMYTLFDPQKMIDGESFVNIGIATLLLISMLCYGASIYYFNKRNLYI